MDDAPIPLAERMKDDIGLDVFDEVDRLVLSSEEEPRDDPAKGLASRPLPPSK